MRWYFPAWNGDHRLVAVDTSIYRDASPDKACVLEISDPTAGETELLERFLAEAVKKRWTDVAKVKLESVDEGGSASRARQEQKILLAAPLAEAGASLVGILKPKDRTITAVSYENGELVVGEKATPTKTPEKGEPRAAASVARPTPCCPQCEVGATDRASECLLAFLSEEEHESWARHRRIVVTGGLSGHRYVLAHRRSPTAARIGRMCFDLDDERVVHFHDNSVPAEEEVLAAKLILEHREPWLRNEATVLGDGTDVFKNPFGDVLDGVADASLTRLVGLLASARSGGAS